MKKPQVRKLSFMEKTTDEEKEKKKRIKKAKKDIVKKTVDLIPIRSYDSELEAFKLKGGRYMDIFKVIPRDIMNLSEDDINLEIENLTRIYKTVGIDIKFLSINFPLNTMAQRDVLFMYRDNIVSDEVRQKWIDIQIDELYRAESGVLRREFYLILFAKDKETCIKNKETIYTYMASGHTRILSEIKKEQKINILTKICNMNTVQDLHEYLEDEELYITDKKYGEIDVSLFERVQPKGGISFKDPSYMRCGDGYVRCLHVYELPTYIDNTWLTKLFNIENCICTYDVSSKNMYEVKKNINKSIQEEVARQGASKHYEELYNATKRTEELQKLYDSVSRLGEVIKLCDFRIYIQANTLDELEERTDKIFHELESDGFKTTTLLNEQKEEFLAIFEPLKMTHLRPFTLKSLSFTSRQLSIGFPFDYSELMDEQGVLLGFSKTYGVVIYDPFTKTRTRKHYNGVVSGDMGSGKSTHLKKLFKHSASIGNYVRTFDVSGEFSGLTKEFGGKIIRCNGSEGMLNPLEILQSGDDDNISFANHISKLQAFFKCIIPSMSDELNQELANQLRMIYELFHLTPEKNDGRGITGRHPEDYPTLSNFKEFLTHEINMIMEKDKSAGTDVETNLNVDKARDINKLLSAVENLVTNYGRMFDGKSTINNITNEKIVTFDISGIKNLGNVFVAQMQNLVSLCWDNAVQNGMEMLEKMDYDKSSEEITKFLMIIDESHRWVNTSMPVILKMVIEYMREARKYFAGIWLASQSISDFIPEANSEALEQIKKLFEFSQYKFMFKQSSSAIEHIKKIFGSEMTGAQINHIPYLQVGEAIMAISGDSSLIFDEWLSREYEEKLFAGGK